MTDAERLNWLETAAAISYTGISFDKIPACEGERGGWRFMRKHWIGDPQDDIRTAIDNAMMLEGTFK